MQHRGSLVQLDSSYGWPISKVRNTPILQVLHKSPNIQRRPIDPTILAASMPSSNRRGSTRGSRGVVRVPQQRRGPTQSEVSPRFMERPDSWGRAETMPAPTRERTERIESLILMEIESWSLEEERSDCCCCDGERIVIVNDVQNSWNILILI